MSGEDGRRETQGAHSGRNRTMSMLGIGLIVVLVLAVILLATGLAEMTPWDGGDASNTTQ
jgi:hypothetical protein